MPAALMLLALGAAVSLRIAAAGSELWLDEIWSLELAAQVDSPLEILTHLPHDNNHFLNTAYLHLVGRGHSALVYRIPAVLAGTLTVVGCGIFGARFGRSVSLAAMTLVAFSYLLVHYSSEARGYSYVLLASIAALESLVRFVERQQLQWSAWFSAFCVMGFLSHPIFAHFWLAAVYWTPFALYRQCQAWPRTARLFFCCHTVPGLTVALLYLCCWRNIELGGGPASSIAGTLATSASLLLGGPFQGVGAWLVAVQAVVAIALGIVSLRGERLGVGSFLAMAIVLPILQAIVMRPPFLFVRYFLIAILFGTLAISFGLGWLDRQGRWGRVSVGLFLILFIAANCLHTRELIVVGRGEYQEALQFIADQTEKSKIVLSSDHNFGVRKLVEFYASEIWPQCEFVYVNGQEWPPEGPDWLILHREVDGRRIEREKRLTIDEHEFRLEKIFPSAPLSGWEWTCYRRADLSGASGSSADSRLDNPFSPLSSIIGK